MNVLVRSKEAASIVVVCDFSLEEVRLADRRPADVPEMHVAEQSTMIFPVSQAR